jgi:hypothetical protein
MTYEDTLTLTSLGYSQFLLGANCGIQVGAEFGQSQIPGILNKDYIWPFTSRIDVSSSNDVGKWHS